MKKLRLAFIGPQQGSEIMEEIEYHRGTKEIIPSKYFANLPLLTSPSIEPLWPKP